MRFSLPLFGAALALVPALVHGQSSVWKVTSGEHAIYVGGTIHLLRATDFPLPAEFDTAFAAADELWFEVDIAAMQSPAALGLMLRLGVLPEGTTLESHLSPEAWAALVDYCRESGLSLATMGRFQPGMLMMNIQLFELTKLGVLQLGVDVQFAQQAAAVGKPTHGFETVEEQVGFLLAAGENNASALVLETIRQRHQTAEMIDTAIAAWRQGDLARIDETVLQEMKTATPDVAETLIFQRNRNWLPQIDALLQTDEVELILVGAGHLPGKEGLLALLEARGCKTEQVVTDR